MWEEIADTMEGIDGKPYMTYGIRHGSFIVRDISLERNEVLHLLELFNKGKVFDINVYELLDDFLGK